MRPFVHKILVVIEPLLIDEDYYARVEVCMLSYPVGATTPLQCHMNCQCRKFMCVVCVSLSLRALLTPSSVHRVARLLPTSPRRLGWLP